MDQNECFSVQRIDIIRLLLNHLLSYLKGLGIVRPLNLGIKTVISLEQVENVIKTMVNNKQMMNFIL